jgi:uncharacterized membrane protein YdbT with pleckstrin-like domain
LEKSMTKLEPPADSPGIVLDCGMTATEVSTAPGGPWQLVNLRTFVLAGLLFWLAVPVVVAVWRSLIVRTTRYDLTSQRLRTTRGIIARHVEELELCRVKDTFFSQSVFERVFGLATVRITSSDHAASTTVISSVPAAIAGWVREAIRGCVEELRARKQVREVDDSAEP